MMDIRRCPGLIKLVVKLGGGASIKQQLDNKHKLQVCVVLNELESEGIRRSYGGLSNATNPISTLLFKAQAAFFILFI